MDYTRLSKTISHALRHDPDAYGLTLDGEGWVPVEALLAALRRKRREWAEVSEEELRALMAAATKQRYELQDSRIRARYGHSVADKIAKAPTEPPPLLFHGTSPKSAHRILSEGLKPMNRQYVHLSADEETATIVGRRKAPTPVILRIRAAEAFAAGVGFYQEADTIWLADAVPPSFIEPL
jgi:putative RNA 2'-phosphotransferase